MRGLQSSRPDTSESTHAVRLAWIESNDPDLFVTLQAIEESKQDLRGRRQTRRHLRGDRADHPPSGAIFRSTSAGPAFVGAPNADFAIARTSSDNPGYPMKLAHQMNKTKAGVTTQMVGSPAVGGLYTLGLGAQQTLCGKMLPVLDGRLYLTSVEAGTTLQPQKDEVHFTLSTPMQYLPFCADFGPLNLGTTHQVCTHIQNMLARLPPNTKIVYYTSTFPSDITNSIYLLGAFLCLCLGLKVEQAFQPFAGLHPGLSLPFRDATWAVSSFDLHIEDCLAGLKRAVHEGLFCTDVFSWDEYKYYDDPLNGDLHEVMAGKFIAFRGPVGDRTAPRSADGTKCAADYLSVFKSKGVSVIVRLNSAHYKASTFTRAGFKHVNLTFQDCSAPPDSIVDAFLRLAEEAEGIVAVHCLAGLGRTGTLIGMYMMKHHRFTAREVIAWLRISRPGSVIGPQQAYLAGQESRMHLIGAQGCAGLGAFASINKRYFGEREGLQADDAYTTDAYKTIQVSQAPSSPVLAHMVTQGMQHRNYLRNMAINGKGIMTQSARQLDARDDALGDALNSCGTAEDDEDEDEDDRHRLICSKLFACPLPDQEVSWWSFVGSHYPRMSRKMNNKDWKSPIRQSWRAFSECGAAAEPAHEHTQSKASTSHRKTTALKLGSAQLTLPLSETPEVTIMSIPWVLQLPLLSCFAILCFFLCYLALAFDHLTSSL